MFKITQAEFDELKNFTERLKSTNQHLQKALDEQKIDIAILRTQCHEKIKLINALERNLGDLRLMLTPIDEPVTGGGM